MKSSFNCSNWIISFSKKSSSFISISRLFSYFLMIFRKYPNFLFFIDFYLKLSFTKLYKVRIKLTRWLEALKESSEKNSRLISVNNFKIEFIKGREKFVNLLCSFLRFNSLWFDPSWITSISLSKNLWNFNRSSNIVNSLLINLFRYFVLFSSYTNKQFYKHFKIIENPFLCKKIRFTVKFEPLSIAPKAPTLLNFNSFNSEFSSKISKILQKSNLQTKFCTNKLF